MRRAATERSRQAARLCASAEPIVGAAKTQKAGFEPATNSIRVHVGCRPGPCCQRHHNAMTAGRGRVAEMRLRRVAGASSHDTGSRTLQLSCACAVLLGGAGKGTSSLRWVRARCLSHCMYPQARLPERQPQPAAGIAPSLTPFPCPFNLCLSAAAIAVFSCRRSCLRCVRAVSLGGEGRGTHAAA